MWKMADKIHVINGKTVMKGLGKILAYSLAGFIAYSGMNIANTISDGIKYIERKGNVVKMIEAGETENASKLLKEYTDGLFLERADLAALGLRLNEALKKSRISELDEIIEKGDYNSAQKTYSTLVIEGVLVDSDTKKYSDSINAISLERLLSQGGNLVGEDKIKHIEKIIQNHPNYGSADELRKEQGKEHLHIMQTYFETGTSQEKTLDRLKKLGGWLKEQNTDIVNKLDFSNFLNASEYYLRNEKLNKEYAKAGRLEVGDEVEIVRNLGILNEKNKEEYYYGYSVKDFPFGLKATIIKKDSEGDVRVVLKNKSIVFKPREVKRISSFEDGDKTLSEIKIQIESIKDYIKSKKNKNEP